jgi:hypothetical protein
VRQRRLFLHIARLDGGELILDGDGLTRVFFATDPSSVGVGSYDSLAGRGSRDRIEVADVVALNRTVRARLGRRHRRPRPAAEAPPRPTRPVGPGDLDDEVAPRPRAGAVHAGRARAPRALPRPRARGTGHARLPRQRRRAPPPTELAPARLDPRARARRRPLLPQLRPPPHLRDAPPLRRPHAQRGRRAPRPRRPRLHRPHLHARDARRLPTAAHHDQRSDPHRPRGRGA